MREQKKKNGITMRWYNTAGFEIVMANGKHILLDPFLSGEINGLPCDPFDLDQVEQCDYLILSHIHLDHAADVGRIQKKFPGLRMFVGDLSADPLCQWQDIDCSRMYRVRPGEDIQFGELRIQVFAGRHTEPKRGAFRKKSMDAQTGTLKLDDWFGSLELQNYLLTACDGTKILVWAGMTSEDQIYRFAGLQPDIALMHVSPKQDFEEFANLVKAINPKIIIPHHYDCTEVLFKAIPDAMKDMSQENQKNFIINGTFDFNRYMAALEKACQEKNPTTALLKPEHHQWYRFGFCWEKMQ